MAARARWSAETVRTPGCLWPVPADLPGLSDHQRRQLEVGLRAPVALLTGTPGTGKTFVLARVVWALCSQYDRWSVAIAAPTGKAAVRVNEAVRSTWQGAPGMSADPPVVPYTATTIHQLLEIGRNGHDGEGWAFRRNANSPLVQRFVVIDEASMCDAELLAALFRACRPGTHVLLVGDPHQLPPVGHGFPLRDLIASGKVPVAELTEIRRNAGKIVEQCRAIKAGERLEVAPYSPYRAYQLQHNLQHYPAKTAEDQQAAVVELLGGIEANDGAGMLHDRVQVVCATNAHTPVSRKELNAVLQNLCNPHGQRCDNNPFRLNDKVICRRNGWYLPADDADTDDEVYVANGEIGRVTDLRPGSVTVEFVSGNAMKAARFSVGQPNGNGSDNDDDDASDGNGESRNRLELAYAITCHAAQGSEWPVVIVVLDSSRGAVRICDRHWLYTAISRAKQLCVLVGDMGVARQMCVRDVASGRLTFLAEELKNGR
jgi:exodeoxyribonuclease V alpha subunit